MDAKSNVLSDQRAKGIILVIIGAALWGISGTVVQYLFEDYGISTAWLVDVRLLASGALLLFYSRFSENRDIWKIWKDRKHLPGLLVFGLVGMLGVQYTFFSAIEYGNAASAAVLQYLAPVIIACYLAARSKAWPSGLEILSVILAIMGTFLLVTGGNIGRMAISVPALAWGIASAFSLAFYTLQPGKLLSKWGSVYTVGWGMMIGGIGFSFINPPWEYSGGWSLNSIIAIIFVVLFGTLIAFYCYMESLKFISASETSLLASVEPLSAAFLAVIWLDVSFGPAEWIGTLFILSTIIILSKKKA
ncbi:DMT family transporter [Mesobacillus zeae]|uniref:EamA family transporter n=1 Tax=Mesobacillus zeae TaxID=1917180 RepID=A0A398BJ08_9BACI|nr:EamA family transporter [Mesobacillus zeae]RID87760.1 EamA family transporter [Mesobacillus zeae]